MLPGYTTAPFKNNNWGVIVLKVTIRELGFKPLQRLLYRR